MTTTITPPLRTTARLSAGTGLRRIGRGLREVLLTLAAIGGVLCIVAVAAAVALDLSLIMFRTGSMDPAIPPGSVALVREIPADQVEPGDVVTVDRPGTVSVTHRVVTAETGGDGATTLVLQGDANPGPDPEPYRVTRVKRVMGSVAGLAGAVSWSGHPALLALLTLLSASAVTWAFWPRRGEAPAPAAEEVR